MAKSISAALRQLLQKKGDALRARQMSREELAKAAEQNARMPRSEPNRNWGDQKKDR